MPKRFRPCPPKQQFLLPPNLEEWLPEDPRARFASEGVEEVELDELYAPCEREDRGDPPYDPAMMAQVLLYA